MACELTPTGHSSLRHFLSGAFYSTRALVSYFIIFAMSRQDLAQAAICLSSAIFSQAAAQSSQHFAQHSAAAVEKALSRAHNVAHSLQQSAQSTQQCMHLAKRLSSADIRVR